MWGLQGVPTGSGVPIPNIDNDNCQERIEVDGETMDGFLNIVKDAEKKNLQIDDMFHHEHHVGSCVGHGAFNLV